jgi:RNA polymerase sigma-70 factor (ECF subfamily)
MSKHHDQDEWLMAQVAQGKRELMEPLVRRYACPLLTFLRRMVGDRHRGEELFQEVFLAVWVKRRQYQFPRPFKAWLFGIAANKCRADFRARPFPEALDLSNDATAPRAAEPAPVETAIGTETAALVAAAVGRLPPQQRAVVALRVWDELSYADIAAIVGRSEGTVRSHMHHGLAGVRKYLETRM